MTKHSRSRKLYRYLRKLVFTVVCIYSCTVLEIWQAWRGELFMKKANTKPRKSIRSLGDSDLFVGWLFITPFLLLWLFWFFGPFVESFIRSFQDANFIALEDAKFIGLDNYLTILKDSDFHLALKHSLTIVIIAVPIQIFLALMISIALNQPIRGRGIFRTIYSIPYITSSIAVTTVFMVLFRQNQIVTKTLSFLGFPNETWYANINLALPFIIILFIWQQVGFFMIIYLAGLQGIPSELYEASIIDGCNGFQKFIYITIPMLRPVTFFIVTVGTINAFQIYDQVAAISRYGSLGSPAGSTSTVITYFYQHGIRYMDIGYGSASVIIFFMIILFITFIQKKLLGEGGGQ